MKKGVRIIIASMLVLLILVFSFSDAGISDKITGKFVSNGDCSALNFQDSDLVDLDIELDSLNELDISYDISFYGKMKILFKEILF